jgi:DNA polymerase
MLEAMGIKVFEPLASPVDEPVAQAEAPVEARIEARPEGRVERHHAHVTEQPAPIVVRSAGGAVAEMDWTALRTAVEGCKACGLCESRKQTVFGVGHARAHWMIVGEAPGEHEDQQGEPFVGASGKLLDAMLNAAGLTRAEAPPQRQVYIANTLKCRPPRNRNPTPAELLACEPFLLRQIALVQPRVILAMGRFAVQSLLRTEDAIGRLRGRVHQFEGRPLIVTYHPSYLLRNPIDKSRSWEDLCLAMEVAEAASR